MTVTPLTPDLAPGDASPSSSTKDAGAFARALDAIGSALDTAAGSENAYAAGNGSLQAAMYDRAQADVLLSIAVATAQRTTQAVQSLENMQI